MFTLEPLSALASAVLTLLFLSAPSRHTGYFSSNNNIQCGQNDFSVKHYAGDVRYQSDNFLTKVSRAHGVGQGAKGHQRATEVAVASAMLIPRHLLFLRFSNRPRTKTRCSTT